MLVCGGAMATAPAMAAVTTTGVEHVCKQIGPEDQFANIAIVCSDLLKVDNGNGTFYSLAQTEAFCENDAAVIVRCANIVPLPRIAACRPLRLLPPRLTAPAHRPGLPGSPARWAASTSIFEPLTPSCDD